MAAVVSFDMDGFLKGLRIVALPHGITAAATDHSCTVNYLNSQDNAADGGCNGSSDQNDRADYNFAWLREIDRVHEQRPHLPEIEAPATRR